MSSSVTNDLYTDKELESLYRHYHYMNHFKSTRLLTPELQADVLATLNKTRKFIRDLIINNSCWRLNQSVEACILDCTEADRMEVADHVGDKRYGCIFTNHVRSGNKQVRFIRDINKEETRTTMFYVMEQPFVACIDAVHILTKIEAVMEIAAWKAKDTNVCRPNEEVEFDHVRRMLRLSAMRVHSFTQQMEETWVSVSNESSVSTGKDEHDAVERMKRKKISSHSKDEV